MKFGYLNHGLIVMGLGLIAGSVLWAANPETVQSSANFDNKKTETVQHAKDGANRALNNVDTGVHKAGRAVKRGALKAKNKTNDGLTRMDRGLHKAGSEAKETGNHALDKVDDTIHGR